MTRRLLCVCAVLFTLTLHSAVIACPNCAESLPGSGDGEAAQAAAEPGLADGIYYSILVMMAAPYVLAGSIGYAIYRVAKQRRPAALPQP